MRSAAVSPNTHLVENRSQKGNLEFINNSPLPTDGYPRDSGHTSK